MTDTLVERLLKVVPDTENGRGTGRPDKLVNPDGPEAASRIAELEGERDKPQVVDFARAVQLEAWHQRDRWGASHNAGKAPLDWFWLIGYLSQKAATAQMAGDQDKALHHTVSTAAALANWHLAISGTDNRMRPGIALGDKTLSNGGGL